jgi:hypothetical protein
MKFSLMAWNVGCFWGNALRFVDISNYIKMINPDIFGLFDVEDLNIVALMSEHLCHYDYNITEGAENREILVGIRRGKFAQTIFTQKREFKFRKSYLRPGALVSVCIAGEPYNILYLHTEIGTDVAAFADRNEMFEKIWHLKASLVVRPITTQPKLIVLGSFNPMGLHLPTHRGNMAIFSEKDETEWLRTTAQQHGMTLLSKEYTHTYTDGTKACDLDHVIATANIAFSQLGVTGGQPYFVTVKGWQQLDESERKKHLANISDHCLIYCEVV